MAGNVLRGPPAAPSVLNTFKGIKQLRAAPMAPTGPVAPPPKMATMAAVKKRAETVPLSDRDESKRAAMPTTWGRSTKGVHTDAVAAQMRNTQASALKSQRSRPDALLGEYLTSRASDGRGVIREK